MKAVGPWRADAQVQIDFCRSKQPHGRTFVSARLLSRLHVFLLLLTFRSADLSLK